MLFLGVDPAMTGAAVLLLGPKDEGKPRAIGAWAWKPKMRGGERVWDTRFWHTFPGWGDPRLGTGGWISSTLHGVSLRVRDGAELVGEEWWKNWDGWGPENGPFRFHLAGENAVLGAGKGVDTSLVIARNAGRLLGPLEVGAVGLETEWVRAHEWRKVLLNLHHRTPREEAKARSVQGMPLRIDQLQGAVDALGGDDVTDAAGVAEWRILTVKHPSLLERGKRKKKPPAGS